jgi:hypothetical protein
MPISFKAWVKSWLGEEEYDTALRLSHTAVKNQDYDEIAAGLKIVLTTYQAAQ